MMNTVKKIAVASFLAGLAGCAATPAPSPGPAPGPAKDFNAYLHAIAQRESGNNPAAVNTLGYLGLYQVGEISMVDISWYKETAPNKTSKNDWQGAWLAGAQSNAVTSKASYLGAPSAQTVAIRHYYDNAWTYIKNLHLQDYVGQTVDGFVVTRSGLLAGYHLLGAGGLKKYLQSDGSDVPSDAYGTTIREYMTTFAGYETPYS